MDAGKLADATLIATLTQYYLQLERRLENAVNPRNSEVAAQIAAAAVDGVAAAAGPELGGQITGRREELVAAVVAHRNTLSEQLRDLSRRLPRPRFTGPINDAYTPLRKLGAAVIAPATGVLGDYASQVRDVFVPDAELVDSAKVTWADLANRTTLLYGTPETPLVRQLLDAAGWQITREKIALGDRAIEGEDLVIIACRARPDDPTVGDVIYASAQEDTLLGINGLHHGPSDYVIGRKSRAGRYQIVTRGNFARGPEGQVLTTVAS